MDQFLQLISDYPEGFGILALLIFFTYDATRPLKIMIVSAVAAISFYYFTAFYGASLFILILGIVFALIDFMRQSRFV